MSVLSLLFMAGTLRALIPALTVGLFGITETMSGQLVSTTLIVESIGVIVLVATTVLMYIAVDSKRAIRYARRVLRGGVALHLRYI